MDRIATPLGILPRLKKSSDEEKIHLERVNSILFSLFLSLPLPSDTVTRRVLIMRGVKRLPCDTWPLMYPAWKPRSESKDPRLRSIFPILFTYFFTFHPSIGVARMVGKFF